MVWYNKGKVTRVYIKCSIFTCSLYLLVSYISGYLGQEQPYSCPRDMKGKRGESDAG